MLLTSEQNAVSENRVTESPQSKAWVLFWSGNYSQHLGDVLNFQMAWAFLSLAGHFPRFIDSRNLWWVDLRGKLITQIHHCTWEDQISSISRKVCDACADTHIVRLSNLGNLL